MDSSVSGSSMRDSGCNRLSSDGLGGVQGKTRSGPDSVSFSSSLVLDCKRGELVEANVTLQRKGISTERSIVALKNHCEAERKRRARINFHLDALRNLVPGAKKMDKAALLTGVMRSLKELKKSAAESSTGLLIPTDDNEVKVELLKDGLSESQLSFKASVCCDYQPGLLFCFK